jgi:hypothetical protein
VCVHGDVDPLSYHEGPISGHAGMGDVILFVRVGFKPLTYVHVWHICPGYSFQCLFLPCDEMNMAQGAH